MKTIINLTLFLFALITIFGQVFTGTVLEKETKQPIQYAEVYFTDLRTVTTTGQISNLKL